MCFAWNKDIQSKDMEDKTQSVKSDKRLANRFLDNNPASKGLKINTQVGVGGKLPDAGK
jgi:hypothetical protein